MIWALLHFLHKKLQTSFSLKNFAYRFDAFILGRKQKKLKENKYDMVNSSCGQKLHLLKYVTTTVCMSYLPGMEAVVVSITVQFNYSLYTFFVAHKKSRGSNAQAKTPRGK